jgi:uncharacterized glyoxalase superfamily protein PhnB
VKNAQEAFGFYKLAFDAEEQYHFILQSSKTGVNSKIKPSTK